MIQALHINSNYLTSRLHENLLDRLESEDIHNTVFMPIKEETKAEFLYESKHNVFNPVAFKNLDKYIFTYKQRKIYKKLHEVINVSEINIAHAHTLFTDGNIAYQLYKDYNIPYVVTVRGYTDIDSFFRIRVNLRRRGRQILANASQVFFLSETNKEDLLTQYISNEKLKNDIINKSRVVPNGIDDYYFENEAKPKTLNPTTPIRFVQVGKIIPLKNGVGSVQGIQHFSEKTNKEAEITFVGKKVDTSYAEKIKNEGNEIATYHEPVSMEELVEIYRQHDIFIMPSFSETFGLVYPEAMSQGLPVIYTKGQGFDGQYEDGHVGYPVNADDPEDIAEKIELIVNNYEAISKNVLEAYKKFNWDNLSRNYIEIYSNLVE
jgi:glycosyltransferase involved in cell wall biosynthesis